MRLLNRQWLCTLVLLHILTGTSLALMKSAIRTSVLRNQGVKLTNDESSVSKSPSIFCPQRLFIHVIILLCQWRWFVLTWKERKNLTEFNELESRGLSVYSYITVLYVCCIRTNHRTHSRNSIFLLIKRWK